MESVNRKAVILHYVSIAADALREESPEKLAIIAEEKREIEASLGLTPEEIVGQASSYLIPNQSSE